VVRKGMRKGTTIWISNETKEKLLKLRKNRETYNDIIARILEKVKEK
jgi:predicted CopG family antitoxin